MFTHTGPRRGDVFAESTFAKQIALAELSNEPKSIKVGNLDSLRTWADVRDAVRAYYLLLTKDPIPGSVYNIGGNFTATIREMLEFLISKSTASSRLSIEVEKKRVRPLDADLQIPDVTRFTQHTGWQPEFTFAETMMDLLEYWRTKISNSTPILDR